VVLIKGGRASLLEVYEDYIEGLCAHLVETLHSSELKLLWLASDVYFDWIEDGFPDSSQLREAVSREQYNRVCARASNEPLHPDVRSYLDGLDQDRFERDQECNQRGEV